jgi:hypothetical protein
MSIFSDLMRDDFVAVFANPDEFGEAEGAMTYRKALTGVTRSIRGVLDRNPPQRALPNGATWAPRLTVQVPNDGTYGILASELNAMGNDKITVAERVGETARTFGVYLPPAGVAWCDPGGLTLELR